MKAIKHNVSDLVYAPSAKRSRKGIAKPEMLYFIAVMLRWMSYSNPV